MKFCYSSQSTTNTNNAVILSKSSNATGKGKEKTRKVDVIKWFIINHTRSHKGSNCSLSNWTVGFSQIERFSCKCYYLPCGLWLLRLWVVLITVIRLPFHEAKWWVTLISFKKWSRWISSTKNRSLIRFSFHK